MKRKLLYIIVLTQGLFFYVFAQTDVQLSQQMFSKVNFNPASTGASNYAQAALFVRQQWVGFDGAPSTQVFNITGYIPKFRSGLGLSLLNDKYGPSNFMNAKIDYAYYLQLGEKSALSFGIGPGVLYKQLRAGSLIADESGDVHVVLEDESVIRPDCDAGIVFSTPTFGVGVSATHITSKIYQDDYLNAPMNLYAYAEANIAVTDGFSLLPYAQFSGTTTSGYQLMASLLFMFNERIWVGGSYRMQDAVVGMVGINITPDIRLGYSYDYSIGVLKGKNSGSHEIMLQMRMDVSTEEGRASRSPRFFN